MYARTYFRMLWDELSRQGFHELARSVEKACSTHSLFELPQGVKLPAGIRTLAEQANWCLQHEG